MLWLLALLEKKEKKKNTMKIHPSLTPQLGKKCGLFTPYLSVPRATKREVIVANIQPGERKAFI
jgi:hypothetical protein